MCGCPKELPLTGPCSACGARVETLHAPGVPPKALYCPTCCPGSSNFTQQQRFAIQIALQALATLRLADKPLQKLAGSGSLTANQAERALAMVHQHRNILPAEVRRLIVEVT